jgi:outer membrane protein assembly factor BamB
MGGSGQQILVTRRAVLTMFAAAGLAACGQGQTDRQGAGRKAAGSGGDSASGLDVGGRLRVPSTGCDTSNLPPRHAAAVAFDAAGRQLWSVPLPVGQEHDANIGPLVAGEIVYTSEGDELRALSVADGRQRWRLPLGGFVYDASVRDGVFVVRVGPLDRGSLVGVDPAGGHVLWRYPRQPGALSWQHLSTADGGIVAIGAGGALLALNRRDGTLRWSRPSRSRQLPKLFVAVGDRVLRLDRGALEAFHSATGGLLWRTEGTHRGLDFAANLTVSGDGVLVLVWDSNVTAVTAYRLDNGTRSWQVGGLQPDGAVVGAGPAGIALASKIDRNQRHELLLVDQASGRVRWRQALPGPLPLDMNPHLDQLALVTASDVVLHTPGPRGGNPAFLAAYRADDGGLRWRIPMMAGGWPTWTADGRLLVVGAPAGSSGSQQSLLAVDVRDGRLLWHSELPLNANRPAAPLGAGAVIQMWDPQRACALVDTADVGATMLPRR